jgi:hypothetical protein
MILATTLWIASLIAGALVGSKKNWFVAALLLCFFLGPIGLIITLLIPKRATAN